MQQEMCPVVTKLTGVKITGEHIVRPFKISNEKAIVNHRLWLMKHRLGLNLNQIPNTKMGQAFSRAVAK